MDKNNESIIQKAIDDIQNKLPGGEDLTLPQKLIFIFLVLYIMIELFRIETISFFPTEISKNISSFINFNILSLLVNVLFVFQLMYFSTDLIGKSTPSHFIEKEGEDFFTPIPRRVSASGLRSFVFTLLNYTTLYTLLWLIWKNENLVSLLTTHIALEFNIFTLLKISIWTFSFIKMIYLIIKIINLVFTVYPHTSLFGSPSSQGTIAYNILKKMDDDLKKSDTINYIDHKEKAIKIIQAEIELLEKGINIEAIEKRIKK